MALILPAINVFAQCDTRREIINQYPAEMRYEESVVAEKKTVERKSNDSKAFVRSIDVTRYVTPISYVDYDYTYQSHVGNRCENDVTNYTGNAILRSMFENGQSNEERLAKIDNNIIGAGPKSAEALLWYFTHMDTPETWNEFEEIVNKAIANQEKKEASSQAISAIRKIITTHKEENQNALGLRILQANTCEVSIPVCKTFVASDTEVIRYAREARETVAINVGLSIEGVEILPNEMESFDITVNTQTLEPIVTPRRTLGRYSNVATVREGDAAVVVLEGVRTLTKPNHRDFELTLSLDKDNKAVITVLDKNFVKGTGTKTVNLELMNTNGINETIFDERYELSKDSATTIINTNHKVPYTGGRWYSRTQYFKVKGTLQITDSIYFNSSEVGLSASDNIASPVKK